RGTAKRHGAARRPRLRRPGPGIPVLAARGPRRSAPAAQAADPAVRPARRTRTRSWRTRTMSVTMTGEEVPVMQPATWMTKPSWFLVTGLPWPEDHAEAEVAEAAFAIAPSVTLAVRPAGPDGTPVPLGHDLALMLDAGSRCAAALGKRMLSCQT